VDRTASLRGFVARIVDEQTDASGRVWAHLEEHGG
jgi:hypothetical protein